MNESGPSSRSSWLRLALLAMGVLVIGIGAFFGWTALETYVFSQRIHLLRCEEKLRAGMTQEEVENLFGLKPEERKPPDPNRASIFPPQPHAGVIRYTEMKDSDGTHVMYTEWYHGWIVTSQHHLRLVYDADGKVKRWMRD